LLFSGAAFLSRLPFGTLAGQSGLKRLDLLLDFLSALTGLKEDVVRVCVLLFQSVAMGF